MILGHDEQIPRVAAAGGQYRPGDYLTAPAAPLSAHRMLHTSGGEDETDAENLTTRIMISTPRGDRPYSLQGL